MDYILYGDIVDSEDIGYYTEQEVSDLLGYCPVEEDPWYGGMQDIPY